MSLISVATLEFHGKQILVARYLSPPIFVCLPFLARPYLSESMYMFEGDLDRDGMPIVLILGSNSIGNNVGSPLSGLWG